MPRTCLGAAPYAQEQCVDAAAGRGSRPRRMTDRAGDVCAMLESIALVLIILWVLGLATSTTMNGFIHILLMIAIVVVLMRVITGRKVV